MSHYKSYLHSDYAHSFGEAYTPIRLEASKGLILKRPILGTQLYDAMGCYPLFCCHKWSDLKVDLENNSLDLISLTVVTDPFGEYNEADLNNAFNSLVVPFKEHFITDLSLHPESFVNKHNTRYAKKALKNISIEISHNSIELSDIWVEMYSNLVNRHNIQGVAAFSEKSLRRQLDVPGAVVFTANYEGQTVGMTVWYVQNRVAYYHLGAYSDKGYDLRASYAIFWNAIKYFQTLDVDWLDIGAGAGAQNDGNDGLSRFKSGWSTGTKTAYLCGHIYKYDNYDALAKTGNALGSAYFPAYRNNEFN
jgi:hypothetical protein